ncbi:MAG: hypothetical protein K6U80_17290 [Firmicutes bacterium]|nr:hypothetical protein [Bacillota bacterium]
MSTSIPLKKPKVKLVIRPEQNLPSSIRELRLAMREVAAASIDEKDYCSHYNHRGRRKK